MKDLTSISMGIWIALMWIGFSLSRIAHEMKKRNQRPSEQET
jgi:hypothetical protein